MTLDISGGYCLVEFVLDIPLSTLGMSILMPELKWWVSIVTAAQMAISCGTQLQSEQI